VSEYIITERQLKTATEAYSEREVPLPITSVFISGDKLPEIVRCRDCKRFELDHSDHDYRSGWLCHRWNTDMVEPDGYCSWGERRDA